MKPNIPELDIERSTSRKKHINHILFFTTHSTVAMVTKAKTTIVQIGIKKGENEGVRENCFHKM